ncbi:MAG: diaminopimelate epimerase [Fimbriimonadaceae bacterium]
MRFAKMHGIGNDFVMVDAVRSGLPRENLADLSRAICDRNLGVGADGLIFALRGSTTDFLMRMFNPDGSESEMCGNGVRCFAKFVTDHGHTSSAFIDVETGNGILRLETLADGQVKVMMGKARLTRGEIGMTGDPSAEFIAQPIESGGRTISATAVSIGNPHLVTFVEPDEILDLPVRGRELEHSPLFPERTNVHFVTVLGPNRLKQVTWERGAGATLACGTGACACAVASYLNGHTGREVTVDLPGGTLQIEYAESGEVYMTGPAETVFEGEWLAPASPAPVPTLAESPSS